MDHCTSESVAASNLVKTARGQVEAVISMIENDRYCVDVSRQLLAAMALLKKANLTILRQHMNTCVKDALNADAAQSQAKVQELISVIESYLG